MNTDSEKKKEIEEILRRMDYLKKTNHISISEKIAITKRALEIIEKSEANKESVK